MNFSKTGKSPWMVLLRHAPLLSSLLALTLPATTASAVPAAKRPLTQEISEQAVAERVEALLSKMTLHEKVGQLTQVGINIPGPAKETTAELVRSGQAGSVLWTLDSKEIQQLQEIAMKESRMKIPLLFGFDVIHGYKTLFPIPLALASSWDPALVERMHAMAAHEASVSGINWNFSPMVDIARDARWGRMLEGAGEDTYLGCAMARAQVRGIQGPRLGTPNRMLGCVKHFAGYGAGEGGRDYDSAYVTDIAFNNVYLPPFKAAIDEGVGSVMSAYMCLNDVPATGNTWLMKEVLRGELGFSGLTISDSWSVASMTAHGFARDEAEAALLGVKAGVDIDMGSTTYLRHLPKLVASSQVSMATVDDLVRQVLATKIRMGLFERPYAELDKRDSVLNDPEHRAAAREAARRSIVLLRNENKLLPLQKSLRKVALIGPLADSADDIKGPWTAEWSPSVTVLEALRAALPGASVDFVRGGDMQRAYALPWDARAGKPAPTLMSEAEMQQELDKAVLAARNSELVIMVLGERANMSGEAASSASLALGGNQMELLRAVVATGKPVVLVLLNGRPLDITWASSHVPSIVEAWFPGSEGGNAICDILFGDANPGAKLPVSWPRSAGQSPTYYNHNHTQARETEAAFTSRYADQDSKPLYVFGHGLSYTTFAFSNLSLDKTELTPDGELKVSVQVENTGTRAGDEVVQLYVHQRAGSAARPVRELKGFQRVTLAAGEKRQVEFTLGRAELQFWSPRSKSWVVEPESFDLWVGGDSNATLHSEFSIKP